MPTPFYSRRLDGLRSLMREHGTDSVLLSTGSDLPYYTGYKAMESERLTMLVVRADADPVLVIPRLEAPRVDSPVVEPTPWDETDDPLRIVADLVAGATRVAIDDRARAVFLLGLQELLPSVHWGAASELTRHQRVVKDADEIAALGAAAGAVDQVLARLPSVEFGGRSEIEISHLLEAMSVEEGLDSSAFSIVASGPNAASPHHEPQSRIIQNGDLVICDFGGPRDGYNADVTRTFSVGAPSERQKEIHAVVAAANQAGREAVGPGVPCEAVDRAARSIIDEAGFGEFFIHRTGHGIGLEVHEHPYLVTGNNEALRPGMAFSVEPGIYVPGELGVRIEDIVVCGEDGAIDMNRAERGLVEVG